MKNIFHYYTSYKKGRVLFLLCLLVWFKKKEKKIHIILKQDTSSWEVVLDSEMNFIRSRKNSLVCQNNISEIYLHYFNHLFLFTLYQELVPTIKSTWITSNIIFYIKIKILSSITFSLFITFYHFYGGITHLKKVTPINNSFFLLWKI